MPKKKIYIKEILSDELVKATGDLYLRQLMFTTTNKKGEEVTVCRIFSSKEYKQVLVKGYYTIELGMDMRAETWQNELDKDDKKEEETYVRI